MGAKLTAHKLDKTIERYLDALSTSSTSVKRRERANCRQLTRFFDQQDTEVLTPDLVQAWLQATEDHQHDLRQNRLSTVRRLVALTPGHAAEQLAEWIDSNRNRLVQSGRTGKVILLRPSNPKEREEAKRYAMQAQELYDSGAKSRASALAKRAVQSDHCCLLAHALLGVLELEDGRPDIALKRFREALVLSGDPSHRDGMEGIASVLDGLGKTLVSVDHVDEAIEVYDRLRRAGPKWDAISSVALGRIALGKNEPDTAARWFQRGSQLHQYNVFLAQTIAGEPFKALIALCRGMLANPFVPPELVQNDQFRFVDAMPSDTADALMAEAQTYATEWGDTWIRWHFALRVVAETWDHPAVRTFLMRALPMVQRNPTSPRLGAFVHACASQLHADLEARE